MRTEGEIMMIFLFVTFAVSVVTVAILACSAYRRIGVLELRMEERRRVEQELRGDIADLGGPS